MDDGTAGGAYRAASFRKGRDHLPPARSPAPPRPLPHAVPLRPVSLHEFFNALAGQPQPLQPAFLDLVDARHLRLETAKAVLVDLEEARRLYGRAHVNFDPMIALLKAHIAARSKGPSWVMPA